MSTNPWPGTTSAHSREFDFFRSIRLRVLVSIVASVGWISLTLLYLAFWAQGFNWIQSLVIVVVSILVLAAALLGSWVSFGLRLVGRWTD